MSFADPQSITVSSVAHSMPRISVGENKSTYRDSSGLYTLTASHQYGKRTRSVLRLDVGADYADPYTGLTTLQTASIYLVADRPKYGIFDPTQMKYLFDAFEVTYSASSDALLTKLLAGES